MFRIRNATIVCLLSVVGLMLDTGVAAADDLGRRGLMGVQLTPVTAQHQTDLGLPNSNGIVISAVVPGTAAEAAGLKGNDVIVKVGDTSITDIPSGMGALRSYFGGDTVKLTVIRDKQETTAELTLRPRDKETSPDYEIVYDSVGTKGRRARTMTTKPSGEGRHPAILYLQGPGMMTIDFGVFPQHPYRPLVDNLTKAGFVVMRVENLGVGDSEGRDADDFKLADNAQNFAQAVDKLKGYDFVEGSSIYLLGHGPGAAIVPMVAAEQNVAGVITFAAFARPWMEHATETFDRRWKLSAFTSEECNDASDRMSKFMKACLVGDDSPTEWLEKDEKLRGFLAPLMPSPDMLGTMKWNTVRELARLDLAEQWSRVDAPVLAVWGQADYISCRACSEFIAKTVNARHEGSASFVALPDTDANFNEAEDQEESFLSGFGGTFNSAIVDTITSWVKKSGKASS